MYVLSFMTPPVCHIYMYIYYCLIYLKLSLKERIIIIPERLNCINHAYKGISISFEPHIESVSYLDLYSFICIATKTYSYSEHMFHLVCRLLIPDRLMSTSGSQNVPSTAAVSSSSSSILRFRRYFFSRGQREKSLGARSGEKCGHE